MKAGPAGPYDQPDTGPCMSSIRTLDGQIALVTGASRGIGRAVALALAEAGAEVVVNYSSSPDAANAVVSAIKEAGGQAYALQANVADEEAVNGLIKSVIERSGRIDVLVNNAGVAINKFFLDVTEEEYDSVLGTNLKGCFFCAQAVAKKMVNRKSGSIINISSVLGTRPIGTLTTYCASKGGLNQLTATMALELARSGVRVNAIAPGYIETPMNRDFFKTGPGEALIKSVPQRRLGQLEDLDGTILLLASDASKFITGTVITVDGGFTVR